MKKRFTAIFLALALCLGLAVPAFAADDTAVKAHAAMAAYQGVMASPPRLDNFYTPIQYIGGFYVDFNQDGIPELVLVYNDGGSTDGAMLVYYYDGTARRITTGYPTAYSRNYSEKWLGTSFGGSGGTTGVIVRYSNGTYGLEHCGFGFDEIQLGAKFSGNALVPTNERGTNVYAFYDSLPSLTQFYTPPATPTTPTQPAGNGLVIPNGTTTIDRNAYIDRADVTQVTLPSSLKTIGEWAFKGTGLTSVTIPGNVTTIGNYAFLYCENLTSVTLSSGVKTIGDWAFARTGLTSLTIPASVTYIGWYSFACCRSLTKLVIENGNAQIGENAFTNYADGQEDYGFEGTNIPVTVHAPAGGAVERYCKANNIPFQPLSAAGADQFTDVPAGKWYAAPVDWAVSKDITNGTSPTKFSPDDNCTHMQILTFLSRAAGKTSTAIPWNEEQQQVQSWAKEKGMIDGSFNGSKECTRAEAVNYIWQALGKQSAKASSFTDVPANASYAKAVDWAVANGVTNGTNDAKTQFSPNQVCTRGHIVTFLHRAYVPEARLK